MGEHCSGIDFAEQQGCLTSQGLPEVAALAACRHEEMKRLPLTLPDLGSTYPYDIDGRCELYAVEAVSLGRGIMDLRRLGSDIIRPTFINDVVRMVRPNDAAAWLPEMREHYTMDAAGRAALIAESKLCPINTDLMCAVDAWHAAGENTDDLSRDLYATIGDPVPPLVWPRQESEQSPTRSETAEDEAFDQGA